MGHFMSLLKRVSDLFNSSQIIIDEENTENAENYLSVVDQQILMILKFIFKHTFF
jgi:hypothetical protein